MPTTQTAAAVREQPAQHGNAKLSVMLRTVVYLADDICSFEFVCPHGRSLPAFSAGAHIDIHLPGGIIRQYSLCNDPAERHRYVVAVLRDPRGRGGSLAMHEQLHPGAIVTISMPRNHFPLAAHASSYVFLAGGIGITPIMSMVAEARAAGKPFHLYYCTRTPQRTAFLRELRPLVEAGVALVHHDYGEVAAGLDLKRLLCDYPAGAHLYYCGPTGFLDAVEQAASGWPAQAVHCERFCAPASSCAADDPEGDAPFEVELAKSGKRLTVAAGQTIADALVANGVEVDVSCRQGYCGTCMTRYLAGQPLHRDTVLDDEDREDFIMICCSRARGQSLVLDL
ncbi:PDR/VanB family oxidoreductase [Pandoraea sp.]|uniref:PDR/VanB family oxidoreductase n=1 Tax=Pandoraea sp. TaxID=1883445 RepID=UPI0025F0E0FA|nr:PDR/VanB family oxidoreductase [Pandoraea sp.]